MRAAGFHVRSNRYRDSILGNSGAGLPAVLGAVTWSDDGKRGVVASWKLTWSQACTSSKLNAR